MATTLEQLRCAWATAALAALAQLALLGAHLGSP